MKILKITVSIFSVFLILSCGSKKLVTGEGAISEDATAASIINNHYKNEIDFNTLQAKLRVKYEDESSAQNLSVSLRMEKDKVIWLSGSLLGITLAKVMITPERVLYYEKINSVYFDGDYELLSNWLGIPLDFEKVQNLLVGQAIYDLRRENLTSEESSRGYKLSPANESKDITRLFWLSPSNYKIMATQISQASENRHLTVTYPSYQKVQERLIPNHIQIIASDPYGNSNIDVEFNDVDFNAPVSFPFDIPAGYKEMTIE